MTAAQIVDDQGVRWWTTAWAVRQLGVSRCRLADWVRRAKAETGFPRVDPPRRAGNVALYRADQLLEAEHHTSTRTRGGRRRLDEDHLSVAS